MEFQTKQMDNEKIEMFRDFSKIENNKKPCKHTSRRC